MPPIPASDLQKVEIFLLVIIIALLMYILLSAYYRKDKP